MKVIPLNTADAAAIATATTAVVQAQAALATAEANKTAVWNTALNNNKLAVGSVTVNISDDGAYLIV